MWRILFLLLYAAAVAKSSNFEFNTEHLIIAGSLLVLAVLTEFFVIRKMTLKTAAATGIGVLGGSIAFFFVSSAIFPQKGYSMFSEANLPLLNTVLLFLAVYLMLCLAYTISLKIDSVSLSMNSDKKKAQNAKILDTSVVVDGRILEIAETGFIDGVFIVPEFVLKEIQLISDSRDSQKRIRGRRALDIINKMKQSKNMPISIIDRDFPKTKEVDLKLVELAKEIDAKIVTNDYNLNKVASIQDVEVLNINDLVRSLSPKVMPNDVLKLLMVSEGQERNQAVGHLEDGTMVVVENAKHLVGKEIDVRIVRFHQTSSGKIIFGENEDANSSSNSSYKQNSGGFNRRKKK